MRNIAIGLSLAILLSGPGASVALAGGKGGDFTHANPFSFHELMDHSSTRGLVDRAERAHLSGDAEAIAALLRPSVDGDMARIAAILLYGDNTRPQARALQARPNAPRDNAPRVATHYAKTLGAMDSALSDEDAAWSNGLRGGLRIEPGFAKAYDFSLDGDPAPKADVETATSPRAVPNGADAFPDEATLLREIPRRDLRLR